MSKTIEAMSVFVVAKSLRDTTKRQWQMFTKHVDALYRMEQGCYTPERFLTVQQVPLPRISPKIRQHIDDMPIIPDL